MNPFELVYSRHVIDPILPHHCRRNYNSLSQGLFHASSEGAVFRGAISNGISLGILFAVSAPFYDFLKEYYYYFFGPTLWLRPAILAPVVLASCYLSIPFDNLKTRLHVMTKLPDGSMPYKNAYDALLKILSYECNYSKYSSIHAIHSGLGPYFFKTYFTMLFGIYISDYAFSQNYTEEEFVEQGSFYESPYIKRSPHNPLSRQEVLNEVNNRQPTHEFYVNESKTAKFSI